MEEDVEKPPASASISGSENRPKQKCERKKKLSLDQTSFLRRLWENSKDTSAYIGKFTTIFIQWNLLTYRGVSPTVAEMKVRCKDVTVMNLITLCCTNEKLKDRYHSYIPNKGQYIGSFEECQKQLEETLCKLYVGIGRYL